ncbi:MAG: flagellin [Desulfobulbaceae bacterium]|nr:flagellin [Desulfobulbaceae bacterium]HIJ78151.1 flagellin [Deltaproteobacteria bacterium]
MAITINNTNTSFALNQLSQGSQGINSSLERLASGRRINKAADDASGMTIANQLLSQARGASQAMRNANDAIAITQVADGALSETASLIQGIREKALQAANASQSDETRRALQADIDKSLEQINNIAQTTTYNGQQLLTGNFTNKSFQVGANSGETINISIGATQADKLGDQNLGMLSDINVTTQEGAQSAIKIADEAMAQLDTVRGEIGSSQNQLTSSLNTLATTQVNLMAAQSNIQDVDYAEEAMNFAKMKVLTEAKAFALSQAKNINKENVLGLLQG